MFEMTPWRGSRTQSGNLSRYGEHPWEQFRRQFDSLFDQFFGGALMPSGQWGNQMRVWDFDVDEKDNEYVVRAELPGFDENDLNVQLHNDVLTVRAEKKQEAEGSRSYRRFERSITLPPGVDAEQVRGDYRNGVLELHIPKPAQPQGKRIPIQGAKSAAGIPGQTQPSASQTGATAGATGTKRETSQAGKA